MSSTKGGGGRKAKRSKRVTGGHDGSREQFENEWKSVQRCYPGQIITILEGIPQSKLKPWPDTPAKEINLLRGLKKSLIPKEVRRSPYFILDLAIDPCATSVVDARPKALLGFESRRNICDLTRIFTLTFNVDTSIILR